ncbi:hypothetical protein [Nocardia sp. NPDC052566]|uniref:hypothetical protein n=1 Tax=Nocardia sp. NPDC052566 TaxID=3364330 RepID=UPI0037C763F4
MTSVRVMGPATIRPDALWPNLEMRYRLESAEWFDPDTGRMRPPPAFVELFIPADDDPIVTVGYDGDGPAPLAESTRERIARTVRWPIPRLVLDEGIFNTLVEMSGFFEQLVAGFSVERTPRGWHQRLTPDAEDVRAEIATIFTRVLASRPVVEIHTIDEFDRNVLESLVTADTRDEDLPAVVQALTAQITPADAHNLVVLDEALGQLTEQRDLARAQVRDRLAIVAGLASGDRRERDELLRRIAGWDDDSDSYRSLGSLVGLSHTAVRKIVAQVSTERDEALDHLDATVRALGLAWDPPPLPRVRTDDYDDEPSDHELETQDRDDDYYRLAHVRRKTCAVCGKPSQRLVRRWQVGNVSMPADPDDPHRSDAGYITDLTHPPSFAGQPEWAVCGTVCARQIIDTDRANPRGTRVAGSDEFFYAVEGFRYQPHDSELPEVLVSLRRDLDPIGYHRDALTRAAATGDLAAAALDLAGLRRDIARAAATLARIRTYTPEPRRFGAGDIEPADLGQVRHGDTIYSNYQFLYDDRADYWEGPGHSRRTWDELTALGELVEVPSEQILLPSTDAAL